MVTLGVSSSLLVWDSLVYVTVNQMTSSNLTKLVYDTKATLAASKQEGGC